MKTAIYKEAGKPLVIETRPEPTPSEGQVVIKVGRCGICGSDTHMTEGGPFDFPLGSALGHEYAGEVVALGKGVEHLKVGDNITALPMQGCGNCPACAQGFYLQCPNMRSMMGGFGEYTLASQHSAVKLPSSLSLTDGALVEPLACGLRAATLAAMKPGAHILVIGAGAIGLSSTYWAKRLGASKITVTATSTRRKDLALSMGATDFITPQDDMPAALETSLGMAPDIIFECSGATGMIAKAIDWVRPSGTVLVAGMCTHPDQFIPALAMYKEVRLQFAVAYRMQDFRIAVDALDSGAVEPRAMVSDTIALQDLPDTLEAMRNPHPQCKVMVDPWR